MDVKAQQEFEQAKNKIEQTKNLLLEKNAELTDLSCRLDDVQKCIKNLKSLNTEDIKIESIRNAEDIRVALESEQVKFNLLKQVNIVNNNFVLNGQTRTVSRPIENLIHCLIDVSENFLPKACLNLYNCSWDQSNSETTDEIALKIKDFVYISDDSLITQAKVDEICTKLTEIRRKEMPQCLLLDHTNKKLINSVFDDNTIFLYRHNDNFLALKSNTENSSVIDKAHETVNNLICEEILYELCKVKLKEKCATDVDKCNLETLYSVFKNTKAELAGDKNEVYKKFLNEIKIVRCEDAIESLIDSQVMQLIDLFGEVVEYSSEYESIKQDVHLFKERFIDRIEMIVFDECENRKKKAESKIKLELNEDDLIKKEIEAKQSEIDKLNNVLSKKSDQLTKKAKEIDLKREQMKMLVDSHGKQEREINAEIEKLRQELDKKMEELENLGDVDSQARKAEKFRNEIKTKQAQIDVLNANKSTLEKKRTELNDSIEEALKERNALQKETIKCEETKKSLQSEINELKNEGSKIEKLVAFIEAIYSEILNNQSLFRKRAELNKMVNSNISFMDLYNFLVGLQELKTFKDATVEKIAKEGVFKRQEMLVNCLSKLLAEPSLNTYRDKSGNRVIELNAMNVNYDEIVPLVEDHIKQEIKRTEIFEFDLRQVLCVKDSNLQMGDLLASSLIPSELLQLIQARMKTKFLINNPTSLNTKGQLTEETEVRLNTGKFKKLGKQKAKDIFEILCLNSKIVNKCLMKTLKIIAGHNVYIEQHELKLNGVNLGIVAGNDVVLPVGAIIDTSGSKALVFDNNQAHGYTDSKSDKCSEGNSGIDGFDGFCGENAGHIYIKATNLIKNLNQISEIKYNGGDGSVGQMGGQGQGGGPGQDTGDAEAEEFGACLFSPSFVVAFARMPGLDPETGEFSRSGELSGKGGAAGKAGFGGMGGYASELLIKDSKSWIANKKEDKERLESSDDLKELIKKLSLEKKSTGSQGTAGDNANFKGVEGGEGGKAGTYGLDHVIFVDGVFSGRTNVKGDYSNYLLEKPLVEGDSLDFDESKYGLKSILENPDAYANRSTSFTVFTGALTVAVLVGAAFLIVPIITAAIAVVPVVGVAAWATGLALTGSGVLVSLLGLTGAAGVFTKKTFTGLDYKIGVKKEMKMKNRQQIMFNNRYCNVPPLRDEVTTNKNLRIGDKRSRRDKGQDSSLKEETQREEHSKANETENEFADAYERAALNEKARKLQKDSAKDEALRLAKEELNELNSQVNQLQSAVETVLERMSELSEQINHFEQKINDNEKKVSEMDQKLNEINQLLNSAESQLSDTQKQVLESVDSYLSSIDKQLSARIQLEFSKIHLNGKIELVKKLAEVFASIKEAVNSETQELVEEKMNLQKEIDETVQKKEQKEQEIEALKAKELNSIKSRMNTEKEIGQLEALKKKMKMDQECKNESQTTDEVMVMKEYKQAAGRPKDDTDDDLSVDVETFNLVKRKIDLSVYKSIFSNKEFPKFHDLVTKITSETKKDRNVVVGKLELIMNAYVSGFYDQLLSENKKESKMDKLKGLMQKDPNKEFESSKVFDEIKKNVFSLDVFYEKIASFYFKYIPMREYTSSEVNQETYLQRASLNMHYEATKNDSLTQLEQDLIVFAAKIYNRKLNRQKLMKITKLVNDYKELIDTIAICKLTALGVIESKINFFYDSIIMSVNTSLSCASESTWSMLDEILDLVELLKHHFEDINKKSLWTSWDLMKNQVYLLNNLFRQVDFVRDKKKEIESWKENRQIEFGVFKLQLIVECLQPKLFDVLVSKCDEKEFDALVNDIVKANIRTSQDKDEYLVKSKLKHSVARCNCVSQQGFMLKYRMLLNMSNKDEFDFVKILDHTKNIYVNSEKLESTALSMFKEYVFLLNENKTLSFEQQKDVYVKITQIKNPTLLKSRSITNVFTRIELILSEKIEENILTSVSQEPNQDFRDQFFSILKQRIKDVEDTDCDEMILRKEAFYYRVHLLSNEIKQDKARQLAIMLTYCNGGLAKDKCSELDAKTKGFLEKLSCKSTEPRAAFEEVLFKLSQIQYDVMIASISLSTGDFDAEKRKNSEDQLKDLINKFNKLCKDILSAQSNHQLVNALKDYVNKLEKNKQRQEMTSRLSKHCAFESEAGFLGEVYKIRKELTVDTELFELINSAIMRAFGKDANTFILSLISYYHSTRKKNHQDFVYDLIDQIDLEDSLNKSNFHDLVDYLLKLKNLPRKYSRKLVERIELKFKSLINDLVNTSNELSKNKLVDSNSRFVLNVLTNMIQSTDQMTRETVDNIDSICKCVNNYKIQLCEFSNVEHVDEDKVVELRDEFVDSVDSIITTYLETKIGKDFKTQSDFEIIKTITNDEILSHFIHYLNIRINLKIETTRVKLLNMDLIENELRTWPRDDSKSMYIDQAFEIISNSYMLDIKQKMHAIQITIDQKQQDLNAVIQEIVKIYKNKLDTENRLLSKARVNFLLELVHKLTAENIKSQEEVLTSLKSEIETKESANEIELCLIEKINSHTLSNLSIELKKELGLNDHPTIEDAFKALFDESLFKKLAKAKIIVSNDVTLIIQKIIMFVQNLYFDEKQNLIYKQNKDLISHLNKLVYSNRDNSYNQLIGHKTRLSEIMASKCYKVDNYSAYIDRPRIELKLADITREIQTVLDRIETLLEEVCLSERKISPFFSQINHSLDQIHFDLLTLNERDLKAKLNALAIFEECHDLEEIRASRNRVLNKINSQVVDRFAREDVRLIPKKTQVEVVRKYEEIFKQSLSTFGDTNIKIVKKLEFVYDSVCKVKEHRFKIFIYLNYKYAFENMNELEIQQLNETGQFVLANWHSILLEPGYVNQQLSHRDNINLDEFNHKLKYFKSYLFASDVNKSELVKFSGYLWSKFEDTKYSECLALLLSCVHQSSVYERTTQELMDRMVMKLIQSISGDSNLSGSNVNVYEFVLNVNEKSNSFEVVSNFVQTLGVDLLKKFVLTEIEAKLFSCIDSTSLPSLLASSNLSQWRDMLQHEFMNLFCESAVSEEKKVILKNESNKDLIESLDLLIQSSCRERCEQSFRTSRQMHVLEYEREQGLLDSIKKFKDSLFDFIDMGLNEIESIELLVAIKAKIMQKLIDLKVTTEILFYAKIFNQNLSELIETLTTQNVNLYKQVLVLTIGHLFMKVFNIDEREKKVNSIIAKIYRHLPSGNENLLRLIVLKVYSDLQVGLKYESSEIESLVNILSMLFKVAFYQAECVERLQKLPILKWKSTLRVEIIKYELNTSDAQIVTDLLLIEKSRGLDITRRFIDIVKTVKIEDILLKYIVTKFRKNEWTLNEKLLNSIEKNKDTSEWIKLIKDCDSESRMNSLTRSELIDEMKRLEANGEINSYIKQLISRNENNKCLIELCIEQLDVVYKASSSLFKRIPKKMSEYDKVEILTWANLYKREKKVDIVSINCAHVLELVAVICRASELAYKYQPRDTQKIALLLFIDSIMFNFSGRLANISTGEGKSLVTISTAIAYILTKGGNVDILTSSEILAERDAFESREMFSLFGITVDNNCDSIASADENVRKERYSSNVVIYGEIGSFQRDILLTKYFEKEIRKDLAGCLIIDEVDSMCIDNICNTLYISHQIADLSYLKDIYCYIWQAVNNKDTLEYTQENVDQVKEYVENLMHKGFFNYPSSLAEFITRRLSIWINNAYVAKHHVQEGNHYSVLSVGKKIGEAVINDLQTGVEQLNTQWSDGLQQFIQLKHLNKLSEESLKAIFMSNYVFFNQYKGNIYGMTGTLGASIERDLLSKAYDLDFFQLPRFKRELNVKENDVLVGTKSEWLQEIKKDVALFAGDNRVVDDKEQKEAELKMKDVSKKIMQINTNIDEINSKLSSVDKKEIAQHESKLSILKEELRSKKLELQDLNDTCGQLEEGRSRGGRCVLIICENKNDVNEIVKALFYKHKHLYEYSGKVEGILKVENFNKRKRIEIEQLRPGDIVVATNIAGRGTDFKISRLTEKNGGLHVIVSYLPANIRIELQAFGRSGRKGENGSGRLIVYDHRVSNIDSQMNLECLKEEIDIQEEERLHEIRVKMISRVMLERELFLRFDSLYEEKIKSRLKLMKPDYRHLQIKSLHNAWAFWLDKMSDRIKSVNTSNESVIKQETQKEFELFAKEVEEKMSRNCEGVEALIDEPGELIKLAKYNIEEGNFSSAIQNCEHINKSYGPRLTPFSHYYKAIALFKPIQHSLMKKSIDVVNPFKSKEVNYSYEQKEEALSLLKKAAYLFEVEIERLKAQSVILADVEQNKSTIGTATDFFTRSNANESTALVVHLMATKSALGLELNVDELKQIFKYSILDEDQVKEIFDFALTNEKLQHFIKQERFGKKIKVKVHVENSREKEHILREILGEQGVESSTTIILDELDTKTRLKLERENINFSDEIYDYDLIDECNRILVLPSRYIPFKKLLVKTLKNVNLSSKKVSDRAELFKSFKAKLNVYCDQRTKIQNCLLENFAQSNQVLTRPDEPGELNFEKLKHLIKQNEEIYFGVSIDEFFKSIGKSKFTINQVPNSVKDFEEYIFLSDSITPQKLEQLDMSSFGKSVFLLKSIRALVLSSLKHKKIKIEDVRKVMADSRSPESVRNDPQLSCQNLKKILIKSGLAMGFFDFLGLRAVGYNNDEIAKCNQAIESLFKPQVRFKQRLELDANGFLQFLMATNLVKSQKLSLKETNAESLLNAIEETVSDKITSLVDDCIKQGRVNKSRFLILDNRDKEIVKFKSFVSRAIMSSISPLKTSKKCKIRYSDLVDYFRGVNLPREVEQCKQLNKNLVLSLSEFTVPWSCKAFSIAIHGSVQTAIGNFLLSRQSVDQYSSRSLALIKHIVDDVAFVAQTSEKMSSASRALLPKVTLALTASVAGINVFNRKINQLSKKLFRSEATQNLKQIEKYTQVDTGTWLTNVILEQTFKSIIFWLQSNDEFKKRRAILCTNLIHLDAQSREEVNSMLKEKFDEVELELNDRINMKIVHLINQLVGPLAAELSDGEFNKIALHSPTVNEIVNIVNDMVTAVDKELRVKLVKGKKECDNQDYWSATVNNRIFECVSFRLLNAVFSENFNKVLNHVLKSTSKRNEKVFLDRLEKLKKTSWNFQDSREECFYTNLKRIQLEIVHGMSEIKRLKDIIFDIDLTNPQHSNSE